MGAWIETDDLHLSDDDLLSHPVWVRGLKLNLGPNIEGGVGRTPCGCVD